MQLKIISTITIFPKRTPLLMKTSLFQLTLQRDLSRKKQDTPCHESVFFHPVLKAYPAQHSWRITAHISLGHLNRQLLMFNLQKTSTHQLLVKLQEQLLASHFISNALLDVFLTQTAPTHPTSQPYNQQYSYSKLNEN